MQQNGWISNFSKKMTQTVAFSVTSQKKILYNAPHSTRLNRDLVQ
ncbi:hypothetical protein VPAL9027_00583 [Vibrio palustris]|uniref:Uncharacterized protein n=1 Tax=Vibrio palustris TaxID=1918946 RepID=A0A1R4B153_9VIBR|nr:hypothetical protein VPAL9027_00583 [Vibrio palustris]